MPSYAKSWTLALLALACGGMGCAATSQDLPSAVTSPKLSGWVLSDLNGDQNVDLATAQSGSHDASGYAQEVHVTLGESQHTSFRFLSAGAIVELSSRDVDGDNDPDLIVFEPFSSQPIGVWLNDGAGSFHQGRLADFRKLWSERRGSAWRGRVQHLGLFAISEERTQSLSPSVDLASPEPEIRTRIWHRELAQRDARRSHFQPRAPPRNS